MMTTKAGRPSVGVKIKNKLYSIRLNASEMADLEKACVKSGQKKAKLCRDAVLKKVNKILKE